MRKLSNGQTCPHCERGHVQTTDAWQTCDYCGTILWENSVTVPFCAIQPGARFYSNFDPDELWIKATEEDRIRLQMHPRMDSYRADDERRHSGHGPYAPCIRELDRTIAGSVFGYN